MRRWISTASRRVSGHRKEILEQTAAVRWKRTVSLIPRTRFPGNSVPIRIMERAPPMTVLFRLVLAVISVKSTDFRPNFSFRMFKVSILSIPRGIRVQRLSCSSVEDEYLAGFQPRRF